MRTERQRGFSLLEAIVALAILASVGMALFAAMNQSLSMVARAEKVRERDATLIVLDHGQAGDAPESSGNAEDDAYYAQFVVPDDLVW